KASSWAWTATGPKPRTRAPIHCTRRHQRLMTYPPRDLPRSVLTIYRKKQREALRELWAGAASRSQVRFQDEAIEPPVVAWVGRFGAGADHLDAQRGGPLLQSDCSQGHRPAVDHSLGPKIIDGVAQGLPIEVKLDD